MNKKPNYEHTPKRGVLALNSQSEIPTVLNGMNHTWWGIAAKAQSDLGMLDYSQGEGDFPDAHVSLFPNIVVKAKNSNQLRKLVRSASLEDDVVVNYFTSTMVAESAELQLLNTRETSVEDQEFYVVGIFGPTEKVKFLTKRFSLVKNAE